MIYRRGSSRPIRRCPVRCTRKFSGHPCRTGVGTLSADCWPRPGRRGTMGGHRPDAPHRGAAMTAPDDNAALAAELRSLRNRVRLLSALVLLALAGLVPAYVLALRPPT